MHPGDRPGGAVQRRPLAPYQAAEQRRFRQRETPSAQVVAFLEDFPDLRHDLGLAEVPHYSTLCYAERWLLKKRGIRKLQACHTDSRLPAAAEVRVGARLLP
jgi:hypothetical protein